MSWLFPGQVVQIDAACPHCEAPLQMHMRDGTLLAAEPATLVAHVNLPPAARRLDRLRA